MHGFGRWTKVHSPGCFESYIGYFKASYHHGYGRYWLNYGDLVKDGLFQDHDFVPAWKVDEKIT